MPARALRVQRQQPLQTFALQMRISGVFITLVWGIIPTRPLPNMEDDGSG